MYADFFILWARRQSENSSSSSSGDGTVYYYTVTGASVASVNGDYILCAGTHGTNSAVYTNGACYLYYNDFYSPYWIFGSTNGEAPGLFYKSGSITGGYSDMMAGLPAPTVTEYAGNSSSSADAGNSSSSADESISPDYPLKWIVSSAPVSAYNGTYSRTSQTTTTPIQDWGGSYYQNEHTFPVYTDGNGHYIYVSTNWSDDDYCWVLHNEIDTDLYPFGAEMYARVTDKEWYNGYSQIGGLYWDDFTSVVTWSDN